MDNFFAINKQIAAEYKPQILTMLEGASLDKQVFTEVIKAKTVFYYGSEPKLQLCGKIDPEKNALQLLEQYYENNKQALESKTVAVIFCLDPYLVKALTKKLDWYKDLLFIFPSADYMYSLLQGVDFSEEFKLERFKPFYFNDYKHLQASFEHHIKKQTAISTIGLKFIMVKPFDQLFPELSNQLITVARKVVDVMLCNFGTNNYYGKDMLDNEFKNLVKMIKYPDISILKDKLKNRPIICVAAGPSLNKNIDFLQEIQSDVFIIAASAALKPLLKKGIKPDLVTTLDMHPEVKKYFDDIEDCPKDLTVVTELSGYYGIPETIQANYIFSIASTLNKSFLSKYLYALGFRIPYDAVIGGAMTVAFMNLQIAFRMGASEIIMLGQDLAYQGATHAQGASYAAGYKLINDPQGKEYFLFESLGGQDNILREVFNIKGFYGEEVKTTSQFKVYKEFLESMIATNKLNIINATEGGAFIEGAEHLSLNEVYQKYVLENKLKDKNLQIPKIRDYPLAELKAKVLFLKEEIGRYEQIIKICESILDKVKKLDQTVNLSVKKKIAEEIDKLTAYLLKDHKEEIEYVQGIDDIAHFRFKYIENASKKKDYSQNDFYVDMKNKAVLLASSVKNILGYLAERLAELALNIQEEYPEYV